MSGVDVIRLFNPREGNIDGIKCMDGRIYAVSCKLQSMLVYREKGTMEYAVEDRFPLGIGNPAGIAWNGEYFLVADSMKKVIYSFDARTVKTKPYLSLADMGRSPAAAVVNAKGSKLNDMEYKDGRIWFSCSAGYSSSVFCVDIEARKFTGSFFTRGPEPKGISLDESGEFLWVLDSSNKEISKFGLNGKWTDTALSLPVENPACFSIDKNGCLWVSSNIKEDSRIKGV